jgi:3-oxoacyl-[acyl-carrier-protein] synthase II
MPEYFISAAATVSHQPTFQNEGFSNAIQPLANDAALLSPDYKRFIEAGLLRRMSKILRMSVASAKDCIEQAGIEQPDAIVVGTGLGCLQDTEKFLNNSIIIEGLLPPTSFIQSTHNTMAGQISLSLANHGYNMTHTQNTLSFELALQDAMLLLDEGETHVLVGAADEYIDFLDEITRQLGVHRELPLTSGASFFMLQKEKSDRTFAQVTDCRTTGMARDFSLQDFLAENELVEQSPDLILYGGGYENSEMLNAFFGSETIETIQYLRLSGIYPTASAFAFHYAVDRIRTDRSVRNVLICNQLRRENVGLTLVKSLET